MTQKTMMSFQDQLAAHLNDDLKPHISSVRYHHTEHQYDGIRGVREIEVYVLPKIHVFLRVIQWNGCISRVEVMPPSLPLPQHLITTRLQDKERRLAHQGICDENLYKQIFQKAYLHYLMQTLTHFHTEGADEIRAQEKQDLDMMLYKRTRDFFDIVYIKAETFEKIISLCLYCNSRFPHDDAKTGKFETQCLHQVYP